MASRLVALVTLRGLPRPLAAAIWVVLALAVGGAVVLARVSRATSYLSDSPRTCINCHVMTDVYATWRRGSHAREAVCVDCHVPQHNPIAGLAFKAADGLKHSYVFTLRAEPQVLRLSEVAKPVVQANCVRCHADQLTMVRLTDSGERPCWDCHQNVHGSVQSLSASPAVLRPALPDAGLDWMKQGEDP